MDMDVRLGVQVDKVTRETARPRVDLDDGTEMRPEKLLFASGRSGNTEGLGLDLAGVQVDSEVASSSTSGTGRPLPASTPRET